MFHLPGRIVAAVTVILLFAAATPADQKPQSSETCGACHKDIYRMWRESAHAEALEDPFFLEPLRRIEAAYGTDRTRTCLACHAPIAIELGDLGLTLAASREGVNCEFCHGLVAVVMTERGPRHELDIGPVKRGTIPGADSRGHEVAYSELHADSLICAPCHEYVTDRGTPIMTTYSEWKASSAAETGKTCQTCHMSLVDANVVDPRIKRETGARVNLHQMPGGHSLDQLHEAIRVKVRADRNDGGLDVSVQLKNVGAGHAVPTGMPGRRILLEVKVDTSDGHNFLETVGLEKSYVDAKGKPVRHVADFFTTEVVKLDQDTRLQPDENRKASFRFDVPATATAWVTVKLHYEHSRWGEDEERVWMTFYSENYLIRTES